MGMQNELVHFTSSHSESQDSDFFDADKFAQLSFIVFEIQRNEARQKLPYIIFIW